MILVTLVYPLVIYACIFYYCVTLCCEAFDIYHNLLKLWLD